jgi:hypothetical protein
MPSASVPPPAAGVLTADAEQDPELWLRALSWIIVVFSVAQLLVLPFGRDQGTYGVLAEGILRGQVLYRDLWDYQPPGIYLAYVASFFVFGKTMMAPRLVEALLLIGAVLGLRRLGGVFFQSRTAGIMGGSIYALAHAQMDFYHSGHAESFGGPLTIYALVITTHAWPRRRALLAYGGIGILFGAAFLLQPALGGGALLCAYYLAARRHQEGASLKDCLPVLLWMGLGSLVLPVLCFGWLRTAGGWEPFRPILFDFAPSLAAAAWQGQTAGGMFFRSLSEAFFGTSSLLAMGTIAAASIHPRASREREGLFLILGVLSFQLAGVALRGTFDLHQFGASIPLIALIAGQGYYKLYRRVALDSLSGLLAFVLFLFASAVMLPTAPDAPLSFWARSGLRIKYLLSGGNSPSRADLDERIHYTSRYNLHLVRAAAGELNRHVSPGASVHVEGPDAIIYSLSQTVPATRFVNDAPQRAPEGAEELRAMLMKDLRTNPPQAIIVQQDQAEDCRIETQTLSGARGAEFPELHDWIHRNYRKQTDEAEFSLWLPLKN